MVFKWPEKEIITDDGIKVIAVAPDIISASRATDIPAFYAEWFINRLEKGYVAKKNPFNQRKEYISFANVRFVVFWTKNPMPLIPLLPILDKKNIRCYFQFTLNDYVHEKLEPGLPSLQSRINTFIELSDKIGKECVVWRFDPIILSQDINMEAILKRIENIGNQIGGYTNKLIVSFVTNYKKTQRNMLAQNVVPFQVTNDAKIVLLNKIMELGRTWNISLGICCDDISTEFDGKLNSKCIDDELICKISGDSNFFKDYHPVKDKGQRENCLCIYAKDIGMYNTCSHFCTYCYANYSHSKVMDNINKHNPHTESLLPF